jgi:hypothetical protein
MKTPFLLFITVVTRVTTAEKLSVYPGKGAFTRKIIKHAPPSTKNNVKLISTNDGNFHVIDDNSRVTRFAEFSHIRQMFASGSV